MKKIRTAGSLFSGIGGFERALEERGIRTRWQAELAEFPSRVLEARFPKIPNVGDARNVDKGSPKVDLLVAGFPCQPSSDAGKKLAEDDPRWLWPEVARVARELEPPILLVENVRGLLRRGLGTVLADLADLGYYAQWDLVPAAALGAPHLRHRVFLVASKPDVLGRVFFRPPIRSTFWRQEQGLPRLASTDDGSLRGKRLEALGNAVVPQVVDYVLGLIDGALGADDLAPTKLLPDDVRTDAFPRAGLLLDEGVYEARTIISPIRTSGWRTPTAAPYSGGGRGGPLQNQVRYPTPTAAESDWPEDAIADCVDVNGNPVTDPTKRFYNPETGQIVQRTLTLVVRGEEAGLFERVPTPRASDGTSGPDFARATRDGSGGDDLTTHVNKQERESWPTPAATDHKKGVAKPGQRRGQLEEAVHTEEDYWPTPSASDGSGGRIDPPETRASKKRPSGAKAQKTLRGAATDAELRTPTPTASARGDSRGRHRDGQRYGEGKHGDTLLDHALDLEDPSRGPSPGRGPDEEGRSREDASTGKTGLNPTWVEWLMGFPCGWTEIE